VRQTHQRSQELNRGAGMNCLSLQVFFEMPIDPASMYSAFLCDFCRSPLAKMGKSRILCLIRSSALKGHAPTPDLQNADRSLVHLSFTRRFCSFSSCDLRSVHFQKSLKASFGGIFGSMEFSTFATASAHSRRSPKLTDCVVTRQSRLHRNDVGFLCRLFCGELICGG